MDMKTLTAISIILCYSICLKAQKLTNVEVPETVYHINKVKEFYTVEILGKGNSFLPGNEYVDDGGTLVIDYKSKLFALKLLRPFDLKNIGEPIERVEITGKTTVILTPNYKIILERVYNIGDINAYSIRFLYAFSKELNQFTKFVLLSAAAQENDKLKDLDNSSFNIPINPEKFVESNEEVKFHDTALKKIIFHSPEVLIRKHEGGFAFDTASWKLILDVNNFYLKSTGGFENTYSVLGFEYNQQMRSQKFILGDDAGNIVFDLIISWSEEFKHYTLYLLSKNSSEQFQFQEVRSLDKFY